MYITNLNTSRNLGNFLQQAQNMFEERRHRFFAFAAAVTLFCYSVCEIYKSSSPIAFARNTFKIGQHSNLNHRATCLGTENSSLPLKQLSTIPAFFLALSRLPVLVHVAGLQSILEAEEAAVAALALSTKLGRTVTTADVRAFVISQDSALQLLSHKVQAADLSNLEKRPLDPFEAFNVDMFCAGSCLLIELTVRPAAGSATTSAPLKSRLPLQGCQHIPPDSLPIRFGILAMFRDEDVNMREWLSHYYWQGARVFVLLDNDSTRPFDASPPGPDAEVHVVLVPERYAQVEKNNSVGFPLLEAAGVNVFLIVDMDEFLWSTDGRLVVEVYSEVFYPETTSAGPVAGMACTFWTMFGHSGHKSQPPSVRLGFTWRGNGTAQLEKCAVRIDAVDKLAVHHHSLLPGNSIVFPHSLQLNHYAIQSLEWFVNVKATRGDVSRPELDNHRDINYFNNYNDIGSSFEDFGLARQVFSSMLRCRNE